MGLETTDHFSRDMLRIRRAAAIAAQENSVAGAQAGHQHFTEFPNRGFLCTKHPDGFQMGVECG